MNYYHIITYISCICQEKIKKYVIFLKKEARYIMAYYPRIRDLREDSDKTQRDIADYLGTAYQYYAVYEKGTSEIPFERAIALAKYYNVSLDYIAGLTNDKRGLSYSALSKEQRELLKLLDELSDGERAKLAALLKALLNASV